MTEEIDVDQTLSIFERILLLRRSQAGRVSRAVSSGQLSVVAAGMRERSFKAGSVLLREGETPAAAYSLVRGRVQVSRRGQALGEVGPGAAVGIGGIISRDAVGLGAVATTDVLALELDREILADIFEDFFPFLLEAIKESSRRHLDFIRRMRRVPNQLPPIHPEPFLVDRLDFVERLLLIKTRGGPFERSSIDALAEIAQKARYRSIEPGTTLWSDRERAGASCLIVSGTIACSSSREDGPAPFRAGRGMAIGALESIAGQPRWHDAVAESHAEVLEHDVDDLIDVFEDNIEMAMDFLAWISSDELHLIETTFGPGPELLDFFTGSSD
jgi:CRP-like cAMP-binding protein